MSSVFPAILIGGPPNRGKSVLVHRLSGLLRGRQIAHYPLRATPDGGGNWFHEAPYFIAIKLRQKAKGKWNPQFEQAVEETLLRRPLPFLVDAGGQPTKKQEELFGHCTHSIILGKDEEEWAEWRDICQGQQLQPLAEIRSVLEGEDAILRKEPILRLQLAELDREKKIPITELSEPWQQLAKQVASIFRWHETQMWDYHSKSRPFDALPLNLEQSVKRYAASGSSWWKSTMLPQLLFDVPQDKALAIYGRAPTWIYSALALHTEKPFYCFDAQYGWLTPPKLEATPNNNHTWQVTPKKNKALIELTFNLCPTHLTPLPTLKGPLPPIHHSTILLSGKLPIWLFIALARHYRHDGNTIAIFDPRAKAGVQINGTEVGRQLPWQP